MKEEQEASIWKKSEVWLIRCQTFAAFFVTVMVNEEFGFWTVGWLEKNRLGLYCV